MTPADSIGHTGHGEHAGPIFPETDADGNWGDIIPPFDYSDGHHPRQLRSGGSWASSRESNGRVLFAVGEMMEGAENEPFAARSGHQKLTQGCIPAAACLRDISWA
jgi:hypothetical protein